MFQSLTIEGFRCFQRFEIPELRRVNLLVGRNNAGKSTVLEAAGLLAAGGHLENLAVVAPGRGEVHHLTDSARVKVDQLFNGRGLRPGARLRMAASTRSGPLAVEVLATNLPIESAEGGATSESGNQHATLLRVSRTGHAAGYVELRIRFGTVEILDDDYSYGLWAGEHYGRSGLGDSLRFSFVPPGREPTDVLVRTWNELVGNPEEALVVEGLQIVEPEIERVIFTGAEKPDIFVRLRGGPGRVPLASLGEGAWRLLHIALYLARIPNNVLLLDEIDTGLHWSVMVKVWRLLLKTAARRDIQVFATTHSDDCIRALAELHEQEPDITGDFMLHHISRDEPAARSFSAAEVATAVEHRVELRG